MAIMLLPQLFEDETLYSLIARIAILNGYSSQTLPFNKCPKGPTRSADLVIDLKDFCNSTHNAYGNQNDFTKQFRIANNRNGHHNDNVLIGFSNTNRNIWRWCEKCVEIELLTVGVSYWHAKFQNECVRVCTKHQISLSEVNIPFRNRQNKFNLPEDFSGTQNSCEHSIIETGLEISAIYDLLQNDEIGLKFDVIQNMFDSINRDHIWEQKLEKIIKIFAKDKLRTPTFLKSILAARKFSKIHLPALIFLYFPSYEFFKKQYYWVETFFSDTTKLTNSIKVVTKDDYRAEFLRLRMDNPNFTKTEIWKISPKTIRWLNRYDKNWMDIFYPRVNNPCFQAQFKKF